MQRNKKNLKLAGGLAIALAVSGTTAAQAQNATVNLDGQPLATSVAPIVRNGTTLVPMRDIFEALGATVVWDRDTQEINAQKDTTRVWLQIGNRNARVGENQQWLSQAPTIYNQSTMVPLRFVSEAMGANVEWDGSRRLVSINTSDNNASDNNTSDNNSDNDGRPGRGRDRDGDNARDNNRGRDWDRNRDGGGRRDGDGRREDVRGTVTIPSNAVVPVTLDATLSSATAQVGDTFSATVRSERNGDAEFPAGTKLRGRVSEVRRKADGVPGVLGLEFRQAVLPDGRTVVIFGDLISLDNDSTIQQSDGRIMAKPGQGGTDVKIVGIGAAAGYVLGKVLNKNELVTAILGAAGGYLYDRSRDKGREQEAVVNAGTTLGVRLSRSVTYTDTSDYFSNRETYLR